MQQTGLNLWSKALTLWSRYLKLKNPVFCSTAKEEKQEQLTSGFAMIRLADHAVVVSLRIIKEMKLENYLLEILAHEIGHHIYCPADLGDHARMIARMRRGLPTVENQAGFIANLYSDLLINDKLKREFSLKIDEVYRVIGGGSANRMWTFYMRIYEILWGLEKGTLTSGKIDPPLEGDAQLGNRLIRNFSRHWLKGAGPFAALCLPYLLQDESKEMLKIIGPWLDAGQTGRGGFCPDGLTEIDADETDVRHPAFDDIEGEEASEKNGKLPGGRPAGGKGSPGQRRQPFEYGQILKSLGLDLSHRDIFIKYYKEQALPHLVPYPEKELPRSEEPILEGLTSWDIGSPMEKINWFESVVRSPVVVPGYTTVEQTYGSEVGDAPAKEPIDLDIYIDSSGSMPQPSYNISYLALAGTIIALSALRSGAKVQATLWSGTRQFQTTKGFISDEKEILGTITGFIGGATAFPIHILRDTYSNRSPHDRKVHILVISDSGVTTIFNKDEKNNSGVEIAAMALKKAAAGGTFVLNLYRDWRKDRLLKTAASQGWDIHRVQTWEDLVDFAAAFSKKKYASGGQGGAF